MPRFPERFSSFPFSAMKRPASKTSTLKRPAAAKTTKNEAASVEKAAKTKKKTKCASVDEKKAAKAVENEVPKIVPSAPPLQAWQRLGLPCYFYECYRIVVTVAHVCSCFLFFSFLLFGGQESVEPPIGKNPTHPVEPPTDENPKHDPVENIDDDLPLAQLC